MHFRFFSFIRGLLSIAIAYFVILICNQFYPSTNTIQKVLYTIFIFFLPISAIIIDNLAQSENHGLIGTLINFVARWIVFFLIMALILWVSPIKVLKEIFNVFLSHDNTSNGLLQIKLPINILISFIISTVISLLQLVATSVVKNK
jgi:hypothetical protein